jgi:hypothetical protein
VIPGLAVIKEFFDYVEEDEFDEVDKLLAKYPSIVTCHDMDGDAVLHFTNSAEMLQKLLAAGAQLDAANNTGETALFHVSDQMVTLMLDAKANPNIITTNGETLIQLAKDENRPELVHALLAAGADPNLSRSNQRPSSATIAPRAPNRVQAPPPHARVPSQPSRPVSRSPVPGSDSATELVTCKYQPAHKMERQYLEVHMQRCKYNPERQNQPVRKYNANNF